MERVRSPLAGSLPQAGRAASSPALWMGTGPSLAAGTGAGGEGGEGGEVPSPRFVFRVEVETHVDPEGVQDPEEVERELARERARNLKERIAARKAKQSERRGGP